MKCGKVFQIVDVGILLSCTSPENTREKPPTDFLQRAMMLRCFHCVKKKQQSKIDGNFVMKLVTAVFRRGTRD